MMPGSPIVAAACVLCGLGLNLSAQKNKEPVDYVDPNIGGIGHLLQATAPTVQLPHAMIRIAPVTAFGIKDRYLASWNDGERPLSGLTY